MDITVKEMNEAFAEVEFLDKKVIAVIVSGRLTCKDQIGFWKAFPKRTVVKELSEWQKVDLVLVGQSSTGTVAVEFRYENGKGFVCLMSKADRDFYLDKSYENAAKKLESKS